MITTEFEIERLAAFERDTQAAIGGMLNVEPMTLRLQRSHRRPLTDVKPEYAAKFQRAGLQLAECRKALSLLRRPPARG